MRLQSGETKKWKHGVHALHTQKNQKRSILRSEKYGDLTTNSSAKDVNLGTITETLSWWKFSPLSGILFKPKLHRRRTRTRFAKVHRNRRRSPKLFTHVSPKSQIPKFECGEVRGCQLNRASECWTPLGQEDSVGAHVRARLQDQECLLDKIPEVLDLQSTWTLLLRFAFCPGQFLVASCQAGLWRCFCRLLGIDLQNARSREVVSVLFLWEVLRSDRRPLGFGPTASPLTSKGIPPWWRDHGCLAQRGRPISRSRRGKRCRTVSALTNLKTMSQVA